MKGAWYKNRALMLVMAIANCLAFMQSARAGVVTIKGAAQTFKGEEMYAYSYSDLITYTPRQLAVTTINDSSMFTLHLHHITHTQYIFLKVENREASMYVSPDSTYTVIFPPKDTTKYMNPYVDHKVEMSFVVNDTTEINSMIIDFNDQFLNFYTQNYLAFIKKTIQPKLDSFQLKMDKRYAKVKSPYFHAYVDYTIAELKENTLAGKDVLAKRYLAGKPVYYNNYQYMTFFNDYFKQYLQMFALSAAGSDADTLLRTNPTYQNMMEVLKIDTLLKSDSLRELVLLKGLYELYYTSDYNRNKLVSVIRTIAAKSKIEADRVIAGNILASFSKVMSGGVAPDFTLQDQNGKLVSLDDYRGQYVYLNFYQTNCSDCLQEMAIIPSLKKKYGRKIVFISISLDKNLSTMKDFLAHHPNYNWVFLHYDKAVIEQNYNIKGLPAYYFIDPRGKFEDAPADAPSEDIDATFEAVTKHKRRWRKLARPPQSDPNRRE